MKQRSLVAFFALLVALFLPPAAHAARSAMNSLARGMELSESSPVDAEAEFLSAIEQSPGWDYPHILLARLYDRNLLIGRALAHYNAAIRLGISQISLAPVVRMRAGQLSAASGHYEEAVAHFSRIIDNPRTRSEVTSATQDAQTIQKALDLTNTSPREAESLLREVCERRRLWVSTAASLAQLYIAQRKTQEAEALCRTALEMLPIRNVMLIGDLPDKDAGAYAFIREQKDTGDWNLQVSFPPGSYRYLFSENHLLPGEKRFLDPSARLVTNTEGGRKYSLLNVESNENIRFHYRTFPDDPLFIRLSGIYQTLRLRALTPLYRRSPYYGEEALGKDVRFIYRDPQAYAVWVVGEFNNWGTVFDGQGNTVLSPKFYWPMIQDDTEGVWKLTAKLAPGRGYYKYSFLVDERYSARDPAVPISLSNFPVTNLQEFVWGKDSWYAIEGTSALDVEFIMPASSYPGSQNVWLVGSFNRWGGTADNLPLTPAMSYVLTFDAATQVWRTRVKLPPGKYQYKFVVDSKWVPDPLNRKPGKDVNSAITVSVTNTNNYSGRWEPPTGK